MREIKFRGKSLKSNKWMFGCLVGHHQAYYDGTSNRVCITSGILTTEEVNPETVGQYTGLKDKNGTEIYEGDILKRKCPNFNSEEKETVIYLSQVYFSSTTNPSGWRIKNPTKTVGWSSSLSWNKIYNNEAVVVGNIHDNPELLIR